MDIGTIRGAVAALVFIAFFISVVLWAWQRA
jgi:hypothetical protein